RIYYSGEFFNIDVYSTRGSILDKKPFYSVRRTSVSAKFVAGYFRGTNRADILEIDPSGVHGDENSFGLYASTGTSFEDKTWYPTQGNWRLRSNVYLAGDYNGDGKTDLAIVRYETGDQVSFS